MPSVEPADECSNSRGCSAENGNHNSIEDVQSTHDTPDPDRQLIPADRIEHSDSSQVVLPTVRESTQNDNINKFLLNSFLQRINDTTNADERREPAHQSALEEEQDQDFDS